jgi:phosphoribosylaminoimidazolecarboxamide formyltransferase/IMP cyclohydrolase
MAAHGIAPIDLVVVNLYPFEATAARGAPYDECVENIDIGGPALIRAAAKNHDFVAVLTEPAQYEALLAELTDHRGTTLALRRRLAFEAYASTAAYDAAITGWFARQADAEFPARFGFAGRLRQTLRYGENPHQQAAFYVTDPRPGVATATQVQGKELSYNNLNDTDAAFECVAEFAAPTSRSSSTPIPAASRVPQRCPRRGTSRSVAIPVSPFGGIVAVNRTLDAASAEKIARIFTEVIIAPDADDAAKAVLARKKNLRLLLTGGCPIRPGQPDFPPAVRRLPGADARCRAHHPRGVASRDAARTHRSRARRPDVRIPRLQAREVERHRLREERRHGRHRRRPDEPRGQRAHRRLEGAGSGEGGRPAGRR